MRRTITVDGYRPDGPTGDVVLTCVGRDLATPSGGGGTVLDEQRVEIRADFVGAQEIKHITAQPGVPGLDSLIGTPSRSRFRQAVREVLPERGNDGSLLLVLLDEVAIVTSLSRLALIQRETIDLRPDSGDPANRARRNVDLCAGWAAGSLMNQRVESGRAPMLTAGVAAPSWDDPDDELAWHAMPELPEDGFRRRRLLDLTKRTGSDLVDIDSVFRDSYVGRDGRESIIHEYGVTAALDRSTGRFTHAAARADVLPGPECQKAAGSAARIIGMRADEVLAYVRAEMTGTTTCTHLNDHLRALGDVHALLPHL